MVMIQTKTFPNESPPPIHEAWTLVRQLRSRTVYMRHIAGTPRPNIMGATPDTQVKTLRFQTDLIADNFKNLISTVDEIELAEILKGLIL